MSLYDRIKQQDRDLANRQAGGDAYFSLSPTRYSLTRCLLPRAKAHLRGVCLDAGAGVLAYSPVLREQVDVYLAMDIKPNSQLSAQGSVLNLPLQDECLDSVFCSQVLEHVPNPQQAFHECFRCLKPGGTLVLSVPHLAYLHNEPHDYFRYTPHGLRVLIETAGLDVVEIVPAGGLLSFVGHIPSVVLKALFASIPVVGSLALWLNQLYTKFVVWADERVETRKLFALNYVAVVHKPESAS